MMDAACHLEEKQGEERPPHREAACPGPAPEGGVAYLGPEGTYSHEAARSRFGHAADYLPQLSIPDVFAAVIKGTARYGVVPVENSSEGAVNPALDEFMNPDTGALRVCGQVLHRISQNLLAAAHTPRGEIRKIYSHAQSLGQCRQWLRTHFPDAELAPVSSNTRAVQHAAAEPGSAAIAGKMAAELYGLPILEEAIQDCAFNTTRFLVIDRLPAAPGLASAAALGGACAEAGNADGSCGLPGAPAAMPPAALFGQPTGRDKTSLMFAVRNESGALLSALKPLGEFGISMSKIESRPSRRKAWEYFFFVDIDGHAADAPIANALLGLVAHCTDLRILGSYPRTGEE